MTFIATLVISATKITPVGSFSDLSSWRISPVVEALIPTARRRQHLTVEAITSALFTEEALALALAATLALALSLALAAAVAAAVAAGARVAAALVAVSAPAAPQMRDAQGNPGPCPILFQCPNWSLVHRRNWHL